MICLRNLNLPDFQKKIKRTVGKKKISHFPSSSVALELWKMSKF